MNFRLVFLFFITFFLTQQKALATHNRAGEIVIDQIGPLTIRATIITYTKASSVPADRASLTIMWGDLKMDSVPRSNGSGVILAGDIKYNEYSFVHTYSGRGTYRISMTDPNRNGGILNVNFPTSDAVPFYLQTTYTFLNSSFQGGNSTPRLLQPPIDKGCIGKPFVHSLNAYDPDGDSVAFRLVVPLQGADNPVPGYDFPDRIRPGINNVISLDETTGRFLWNSPREKGEYNIAFQIISYRRGIAIDTTIRDMQVLIEDCKNDPPKVETIDKICVVAGQLIKFPVRATDPNAGQKVSLTALGGPFVVEPAADRAVFKGTGGTNKFQVPPVVDTFRWQTTCNQIEEYPYTVVFKAVDNFNDSTGLSDLKTVQIKVVGPPPILEELKPGTNQVKVAWRKPYACENALNRYFYAFSVWRREGSNPFPLDTCTTGLDGKGYTRIAYDTTFQIENGRYIYVDNTTESGRTFCYRIVAHFARRTVSNSPYNLVASLPSNELCAQLKRDIPLITNVSVQETNAATGRILVRWTKPLAADLDTVLNPGPYKYVVFRATGITKTVLQPIAGATFTSATYTGANDTTWIDNNLNTIQNPYSYRIGFYVKGDSLLGYSNTASSHFLTVGSSDRTTILTWQKDVPWSNSNYDIFRLNRSNNQFEPIGSTNETTYRDGGLTNKTEYCYYVQAVGSYSINGVPSPLINLSQRACGTPIDTVPPCPPVLTVTNGCDSTGVISENDIKNKLNWTNPAKTCKGSEDAVKYNVYYADTEGGAFRRLETINDINKTNTEHKEGNSVAGCYYVTALDSVGNESRPSNIICLDNCPFYELPNAFTPNGDGENDKFTPRKMRIRFINKVEFKVYNRWGGLVFETNKPSLDWNGQNLSGADVAEGTYFYTCLVFEKRLTGEVLNPKILRGYIELVR